MSNNTGMMCTGITGENSDMPNVYCAAMDCKFNGDDGKCHAKSIVLSANSIMTVWEGRQQFNKCKTYEESDRFK